MDDNKEQSQKQQKNQAAQKAGSLAGRAVLDYATGGKAEQLRNMPVVGNRLKKAENKAGKKIAKLDKRTGGKLGKVAKKADDAGLLDAADKGLSMLGGAKNSKDKLGKKGANNPNNFNNSKNPNNNSFNEGGGLPPKEKLDDNSKPNKGRGGLEFANKLLPNKKDDPVTKKMKMTIMIKLLPVILIALGIIIVLTLILLVASSLYAKMEPIYSIKQYLSDDEKVQDIEDLNTNEAKFYKKLKKYNDNASCDLNIPVLISTLNYDDSLNAVYDDENAEVKDNEGTVIEEADMTDEQLKQNNKKLKQLVKAMEEGNCAEENSAYDDFLKEEYIPEYLSAYYDKESEDADKQKQAIIDSIYSQASAYKYWFEDESDDCVTYSGDKLKVRFTTYQHQGSDNSLGGTIGVVQPYINQGIVYEDENGFLLWKGGNTARGKTYGNSGTDYLIIATATKLLIGKYGYTEDENVRYFEYGDTFQVEVSFSSTNSSKLYNAIALDACGACMSWSITSNGPYAPKSQADRDYAADTNNMKLDIFTQPSYNRPDDTGYFIGSSGTSNQSSNSSNSDSDNSGEIYYNQHDYKQPFCKGYTNTYSCNDPAHNVPATIETSGCGITAFAMVAASLNNDSTITPDRVASWICDDETRRTKYRIEGQGTNKSFFLSSETGSEFKVNVTEIDKTQSVDKIFDQVVEALKSGKMIIASLKDKKLDYHQIEAHNGQAQPNNVWGTAFGHYLALSSINDEGQIKVLDPASEERTGYFSQEDIKTNFIGKINSGIYIVSKANADVCENYSVEGDYENWKQSGNSPWAQMALGHNGRTIANAGCAATSVAIQIARSGTKIDYNKLGGNEFNPGTFVNWMNNNGGFDGTAIRWWIPHDNGLTPNFKYLGKEKLHNSSWASLANQLKGFINERKYAVCSVKWGGHWVAIDSVEGNTIYINDPGSSYHTTLDAYDR